VENLGGSEWEVEDR